MFTIKPVRTLDQAAFTDMAKKNHPLADRFDNTVLDLDHLGKQDWMFDNLRVWKLTQITHAFNSLGFFPIFPTDKRTFAGFMKDCLTSGIKGAHVAINQLMSYLQQYGPDHFMYLDSIDTWMGQSFVYQELKGLEASVRRGEQVVLVSNFPTMKFAIANRLETMLQDVLPRRITPQDSAVDTRASDRTLEKHTFATADGVEIVYLEKGKVDAVPVRKRFAKPEAVYGAMEFDGRDLTHTPLSAITAENRSNRTQAQRLRDELNEFTLDMIEMAYETDDAGRFCSLRNPAFESLRGELF